MVLTLYTDPLSQPSRVLTTFLRVNKIEYEEKRVSLLTGQLKTPEFTQINRFKMVPAIVHDGFHLSEASAIVEYLLNYYPIADHWYPKDPKARARVHEFVSWQHTALRIILIRYMTAILQTPVIKIKVFGNRETTPEDAVDYKTFVEEVLDVVENVWLKESPFVSGDQISAADLFAVAEIETLRLVKHDFRAGRPKLTAYFDRVREFVGAELYDEVHKRLDLPVFLSKDVHKQFYD